MAASCSALLLSPVPLALSSMAKLSPSAGVPVKRDVDAVEYDRRARGIGAAGHRIATGVGHRIGGRTGKTERVVAARLGRGIRYRGTGNACRAGIADRGAGHQRPGRGDLRRVVGQQTQARDGVGRGLDQEFITGVGVAGDGECQAGTGQGRDATGGARGQRRGRSRWRYRSWSSWCRRTAGSSCWW